MTPHNLPQDWQWVSINSICEKIMAGGDKPTNFSPEKTQTHNIPIYANAIKDNGLYGYTDKAVIQEPAITISARGTIGFVCPRFEPFVPIVRLLVVIPKQKIDLLFLSYILKHILPKGNGSSIPQLTIPKFKEIQIPLPPLEIQKQIVEILESRLEKIAQIQTRLETILKQCQTYRLSLLADAFNGNLTPHSQDWRWVRLGEITQIIGGTTPSTTNPEYWDGEFAWITPAEIQNDSKFIYTTKRQITQKAIKDKSLKPLPIGTILLSSRAPIGKVAIVGSKMYCNQGFKNLVCDETRLYNLYLFYFLKGKTAYLNSLGRGTTFKEISKSIVEKIEIPLPPLEIQKEIVEILESKLEKIENAQALIRSTLKECETYRLSLLESAFRGELVNGKFEKGFI